MVRISLRIRIVAFFMALSLLLLLNATFFQYNKYSESIRVNLEAEEQQITQQTVNTINTWVDGKLQQLSALLQAHPEFKKMDKPYIAGFLKTIKESDSSIEVAVVVDQEGIGLNDRFKELDLKERDYFKAAKENKKPVISDVVLSKTTGNRVFVVAVPVLDDSGNFLGTIQNSISVKVLEGMLKDVRIASSGYSYLLSTKGEYIYYPKAERLGKSFLEYATNEAKKKIFTEQILGLDNGIAEYADDDGTGKIAAFGKVPLTGWKVISTAPSEEVFADLSEAFQIAIITLLLSVAIALVASLFLGITLSRPVVKVSEVLKHAAGGDMTSRVNIKRRDEIGDMARNLNEMTVSVAGIIQVIREKSNTVEGVATALSATSEQIAASSGQVAESIQEAAKELAVQVEELAGMRELLESLDTSLNNMSDSLQSVKAGSDMTEKLSREGTGQIHRLGESLQEIQSAFEKALGNINALSEDIKKVDNITALIKSISDQTNLLSLNAAIEAARAGEAGKGFAVVADQIRVLADQSRSSTDSITKILKTILQETAGIVDASNEARSKLVEQVMVIDGTTKAFEGILDSVFDTVPKINRTYEGTRKVVDEKNRLVEKVQQVAQAAEHANATTQQVAASAEEMTAATQEITSTAQGLEEVSRELVEKVSVFKT